MSEEKKYFICRNDNCDPNILSGGIVFEYDPVKAGEKFQCTKCNCEYIEESGAVFYVAKGNTKSETIIESVSDFLEFRERYSNTHVHFQKLILRNIKEKDFQARILTFSNCRIDELIIENTSITSAYYPISLFNCLVKHVKIINTKITESKRKDYRGLWSFYGINLFQTEITESFTIEGSQSSLIISECKVLCPIEASGKSTIDLALANNERKPEIKAEKNSVVNDLFMISGRAANTLEKKASTKGKIIKGIRIGDLYIDSDIEAKTTIEDCTIGRLIFGDSDSIKGKLLFLNCKIENTENEPYCFDKDVIFIGCTFSNVLSFSRARCRQSIVFEACKFEKQAIFNDLKIEEDLHLNYSSFKDGVNISGNNCQGYIKTHFVSIGDGLKMEDNVVGRDINFRCISVKEKVEIYNNKTTGYLFLRQIRANQDFEMNWLNANELDIYDMLVNGKLGIQSTNLQSTLRITSLCVDGKSDFSSIILNGDILISRSVFKSGLSLMSCESIMNIFNTNDFGSDCNYFYSTVNRLGHIQGNLFRSSISLNTIKGQDVGIKNNHMLKDFGIYNTEANKIECMENTIFQDISIENIACSEIEIESNAFMKNVDLLYCTIHKDLTFSSNLVQKLILSNTVANKIKFNYNNIYDGFAADYQKINLFTFTNNIVQEEFSLKDVEIQNSIEFYKNEFGNNFEINLLEGNDIFINNNIFWQDAKIYNAEIDDLFLRCNSCQGLAIYNGSYTNIDISECEEIGQLDINGITVGKDLKILNNKNIERIEFWLCTINNQLQIDKNEAQKHIYIDRTQADFLRFSENITESLRIKMGKYRQLRVNENTKIGVAEFIYFTVENDFMLNNNIFSKGFEVNYCRIENNLEFYGNTFQEGIILGNNNIRGSVILNDKLIKDHLTLEKNFVENDINLTIKRLEAGLLIAENNVDQKCLIANTAFSTDWKLTIRDNKFNDFVLENTEIDTTFYFDDNVVDGNLKLGKRILKQGDKVIKFIKPVSISDNKIRNGMFYNLLFEKAVILHSNNIAGDITFHDCFHLNAMDFTGSFVGGSFSFLKTKTESFDGDLILDNIFIDKKIALINSYPFSFSYKNATFNGFEIPVNWKMHKKRLVNTFYKDPDEMTFKKISNFKGLMKWLKKIILGGKKLYVFRENNLRKRDHQDEDVILPYNLIKSQYEADSFLNGLAGLWKKIQFEIIPDEEKKKILTEHIEHGENIINGSTYFNECINQSFLPVYYEFYDEKIVQALLDVSKYFMETKITNEVPDEAEDYNEVFELIKDFCIRFHYSLWYFKNRKAFWGGNDDKKNQQLFQKKLNESLEEQYRVLRQIYRNEGELTNEDWSYFKWMHYKNLGEANSPSFKKKLKSWSKYLIFEKTFGWGVDLWVILRSTVWITLLFAAIYFVMFQINPDLKIKWDELPVLGSQIDLIMTFVLALQTTFSAVLGDWAPIGSGAIKIPMTINAVLGVFFVTFLIGAYGRKMLR